MDRIIRLGSGNVQIRPKALEVFKEMMNSDPVVNEISFKAKKSDLVSGVELESEEDSEILVTIKRDENFYMVFADIRWK